MKKKISDFVKNDAPYVCLTAYTAPMTAMTDAHCDLLLVGDSVSMVLYGEDTTQKAGMEMMIRHGRAVAKTAKHALVVVDMPFGSYENSPETALINAQRIMNETGCNAIKLEGGLAQAKTIKTLTDNDVPVMAHIGLTPQAVSTPDGYRVQGRGDVEARQLMEDAKAVEAAGAFCVVVEAVPEPLAVAITEQINIPTIGIGASVACDGQILVTEDMLGLTLGNPPKFVKQYAMLNSSIETAVKSYADEVKNRDFPALENTYKEQKSKVA